MAIETQSVEQTVSVMAKILAKYLDPEKVILLTAQWRQYPTVSVKMMQQCVLEATTRYPELKSYKSEIRKGFWNAMQTTNQDSIGTDGSDNVISGQKSVSEATNAFYTVMEGLKNRLTAPDARNLFHVLHQTVSQERTFKEHIININQFLEGDRPAVPDDIYILNNIVQLAYVCLCDITGPVEADDILFAVAETAKQSHPKAVVETLF
jgi:hypothetical protein